jgi:hypothetical protein
MKLVNFRLEGSGRRITVSNLHIVSIQEEKDNLTTVIVCTKETFRVQGSIEETCKNIRTAS